MFNRGDIPVLLIALKWTAMLAVLLLMSLFPVFYMVLPLMLLLSVGFSWTGAVRELRKRRESS